MFQKERGHDKTDINVPRKIKVVIRLQFGIQNTDLMSDMKNMQKNNEKINSNLKL